MYVTWYSTHLGSMGYIAGVHELDRRSHLHFNPASQFVIANSFLCSAFSDFQRSQSSLLCTSNGVGRGWEGEGVDV